MDIWSSVTSRGTNTMDKVLSSYYSLGTQAADYASSASLHDAHDLLRWFLLDMPVAPWLLMFHVTYVADRVHALTGGRQFWFKSFVLTAFAAFGGSTLAAVLQGSPAPLFTHSSNIMFGYLLVAWYLVNQSRAVRLLLRSRPLNAVLAFGASAAKARNILAFVDKYILLFPGSIAGAIALGGVCGSGGLLFISMEKKARQGFHTPSEISEPGWGFKSAYLVAALYYMAIDPSGLLFDPSLSTNNLVTRDFARYALSLGLSLHAAVETMLRRHINPVYLFERLLYAVTRVPSEPVLGTIAVAQPDGESSSDATKVSSSSSRSKRRKKNANTNKQQQQQTQEEQNQKHKQESQKDSAQHKNNLKQD